MRLHSSSGSMSRTSCPSTSTVPPVVSNSRGTRLSSVVLPAPVLPMIAVVSPATALNEMSQSTGKSAPGYLNSTSRSSSELRSSSTVTGSAGGTTDDFASSTSTIRSALTEARGVSIATNVASITDIRIWIR